MIRSFTKAIRLQDNASLKVEYSDLLDSKIAYAIEMIQNKGGSIVNSSLIPTADMIGYQFYVLYEDNGNYQAIDNCLRKEIFNFKKLKL
ncbi:MAG: hypothetical protein RR531_02255 [Longicatena sp.]